MKSFAQIGQSRRINRIEDEELVPHQSVDERAAFLFQCHRHLSAAKTLSQLGDPASQDLGAMFELEALGSGRAGGLQRDVVFLIRPVDRD